MIDCGQKDKVMPLYTRFPVLSPISAPRGTQSDIPVKLQINNVLFTPPPPPPHTHTHTK
jgi:hypothetical protein